MSAMIASPPFTSLEPNERVGLRLLRLAEPDF